MADSAFVTAAPLVTLVAPTVDAEGVCGNNCIPVGWEHLKQIQNMIFMSWTVAASFTLLSTLRTYVTGERNLFGVIPVTEETVDRVLGIQYWLATHNKWFVVTIFACLMQLLFFIERFESKQVPGPHSTIEIGFGAIVLIEFLVLLLHTMFLPTPLAVMNCISRIPVDITIIFSSFMLGRVTYDATDHIDAVTIPGNSITTIQTKTWYVPTQFICFRLMYVWRRWFVSLPISNSASFKILRLLNIPICVFPFLFVAAISVAVYEEAGFDPRWYLNGPPMEEDKFAVLAFRSYIDPYPAGMPFFQYDKLWGPELGGDQVPEEDMKQSFNMLWTPLGTAYFYFLSLLTIGPGDLSPATHVGRIFTIGSMSLGLGSVVTLLKASRRLYKVMLEGKQAYMQKRGVKHIVVTGTPCFQQIQDFVTEMYHDEKMVTPPPVSAEFEPPPTGMNTETVLLLEDPETCDRVRQWLHKRENIKYRSRVFVYNGSVWDGLIPTRAYDALMVFVLPNLYTLDIDKDDESNVMRVLQMKSALLLDIRITVLLHVSERKDLLRSAGLGEQFVISLDEFKAAIAMKSCFLPGFGSFVCNLFKTVSPSFAAKTETAQADAFLPWEKMYFAGLEKEIYEVDLSKAYYGLSFGEIVLDILHRCEGEVLLIGVVEYGVADLPFLRLNPGAGTRIAAWVFDPNYKDSPQLAQRKVKGVFIAPDIAAVAQKFYLPGQDDVGLAYREQQKALQEGAARAKAREQQGLQGKGAGNNKRLAALEKKRQRKLEEQETEKQRKISKNMTLKEKIRASKTGDLTQLYGVPSIQKALEMEYPNTTMDEIPGVMDPVWKEGTDRLMHERKEFKRTLAEIHAVTDMKALNRTGLEMQTGSEERVLQAAKHRQRLREFLQLRVRPDIRAREMYIAHSDPKPPPLEVLANGGHIVVCCLGSAHKCNVRIYPAIRALRLHSNAPLVILAQAVPPDWHRVLEAKGIYMLHGNPSSMFDLKRSNFEHATHIVILAGGAGGRGNKKNRAKASSFLRQGEDFRELYRADSAVQSSQFVADTYAAPPNMNMVDADGIFVCKLIEGNLPPLSSTTVILELLVDENYYLVPLRSKGKVTSEELGVGGDLSDEAGMAAHRAALLRQPRYASGRLFCSSMITSLIVNILYNTSLVQLVSGLITCKGATVEVPMNWVGMPLLNFMESLIWHHNLIPIGIARLIMHEKPEKKKRFNPNELPPPPKDSAMKELTRDIEPRFIMAAPHAFDELLHAQDKLVCIAKYDVTDQDLSL
ncbi:unnamed protein product [Amoebophrya sp. A25]|nr:unnamed protein product [Amoebophrya sp. A25]|eukprot:GSA25T00024242001.1